MYSTDGGEQDPVRLFKLWLSKRPAGMEDKGPLYLGIIERPKSSDIWYTKIRMGQNTIGKIMKSMATTLKTDKKITNHSMRKTLVSKLKNAGQPRHVIKEITGHAREASIDDYDEVDDKQRKQLSHIISGYNAKPLEGKSPSSGALQVLQPQNAFSRVPSQKRFSTTSMAVNPTVQQFMNQAMFFNPSVFYGEENRSLVEPPSTKNPTCTFTSCTINNYFSSDGDPKAIPKKKRRAFILESDDEE